MNPDLAEFLTDHEIILNPQQTDAVKRLNGKTLLLAVPGSGKTTVLIARLGYMLLEHGISADRVLALTFSRAGVADLRNRFESFFHDEALMPRISTIHSFAYSVIRLCQNTNGRRAYEVVNNTRPLLREIYKRQMNESPTELDLNELEKKITYAKNLMLGNREAKKLFGEKYTIREEYENYKDANHLIDFDDMLLYAYKLLRRNPQLLQYYRDIYPYILVDEAQDNSRIQHEIIKLLIGDQGNLFMVADEDQSIYGFRGAFPSGVTDFQKNFPDGSIIKMETNYRAPSNLVDPANSFIKLNDGRLPKRMTSSYNEEGPPAAHRFFGSFDERDSFILECAKNEGKTTAVLFRNNDSAIPIVDLLDREGIKFNLRESNPTFFSNFIMRDLNFFYRLARKPSDAAAFRELCFKLNIQLSKKDLESFNRSYRGGNVWLGLLNAGLPFWLNKQIEETRQAFNGLADLSPQEFLDTVVNELGYDDYLRYACVNDAMRDNVMHKFEVLRAIAGRESSVADFFKRIDELKEVITGSRDTGGQGCLTLTTIHSAKGLEFEKVLFVDVTSSILPSPVGDENEDEQSKIKHYLEEVRLFYVGVTRAKSELSFLTIGTPQEQPVGQEVSPFIHYYFHPESIEDTKSDQAPEKKAYRAYMNKKAMLH